MKKKQQFKFQEMELFWRWHYQTEGTRRIWRADWIGDQFEIIPADEFEVFERWCKQLGISVVEADD